MSNNYDENVKNQSNLKNNRLSLPSSSSASSFDFKDSKANPYSHLEYYQKMENLLSHNQTSKINSSTFKTNIHPPIQYQTFQNQNLNSSINFPRFQNWTNKEILITNNFRNNFQTATNIHKSDFTSKSNDNENLIIFDTNDDWNVLDAFDPLKNSSSFQDGHRVLF